MATIRGNVCNTYVHIDLILTETGTNVDKNTSTVGWKLVGYLGSGATSSHWYSNSYHSINVKVNGSTVYDLPSTTQKSISIGTNTSASSPVTIASGTTTVPHNADGTKTCSASFSMVYRYSSSFSWNGSGSFSLKTIPRATTPTVSSSGVAMGTAVIISTPRASSSYTHTLTYKFGNATGTIGVAKKVTTSQSWTPPLTLANQIPNSTGGTCVITCTTYNSSGTAIGSKTVSLALTVPASVVPKINSWTATDPSGYKDKYGDFVQGYSKAKITVNASGAYGSTISSYKIFDYRGGANAYTTEVLTGKGYGPSNIKVTDSRGRTAELVDNVYIDILAYNQPSISKLSVARCNSDGTANAEGDHIKVTIKASITALNNKNSKSFKLEYKASDATSWTTVATYTAAYSIDTSEVIAASIDKSYRVRLTAKDDFKTIVKEVTAGTAFTLLDFYSSGKGMAVGKVAEIDELLDINLRTRHRVDEDFMIGAAIYGMDADGNTYEVLYPRNSYGNTVIGYGNYENKSGNTNIYGTSVNIAVSETPNPASYKPYVCKGDTLDFEIATAGYITSNSTNICFFVPCSRYILGSPTVSAISVDGLIIRQAGKYTHGSSATKYVKPSSYSVSATQGGFNIVVTISTTTNAVNNDACGVRWSGKIVLS